jgi:hypothetical protein
MLVKLNSEIELKDGVIFTGVHPYVIIGMNEVGRVYQRYNKKLTITSILDGKHMVGSKHYLGLAFDCRIWGFTKAELIALVKELKRTLGCMFDVVLETEKVHIHIEWRYNLV